MIIDLVFLICLIICLIRGFKKGIIIALFSLIAVIIGVMAALQFSGLVASRLFDAESSLGRWAPTLSYIIVFFLVLWLMKLLAGILQKSVEAVALGGINRLAGALLYGFLVCFGFSALLWLTTEIGLLNEDTGNKSKVYPYLLPLAPTLFDWIGQILPFVKSAFEELSQLFRELNDKINSNVGIDR